MKFVHQADLTTQCLQDGLQAARVPHRFISERLDRGFTSKEDLEKFIPFIETIRKIFAPKEKDEDAGSKYEKYLKPRILGNLIKALQTFKRSDIPEEIASLVRDIVSKYPDIVKDAADVNLQNHISVTNEDGKYMNADEILDANTQDDSSVREWGKILKERGIPRPEEWMGEYGNGTHRKLSGKMSPSAMRFILSWWQKQPTDRTWTPREVTTELIRAVNAEAPKTVLKELLGRYHKGEMHMKVPETESEYAYTTFDLRHIGFILAANNCSVSDMMRYRHGEIPYAGFEIELLERQHYSDEELWEAMDRYLCKSYGAEKILAPLFAHDLLRIERLLYQQVDEFIAGDDKFSPREVRLDYGDGTSYACDYSRGQWLLERISLLAKYHQSAALRLFKKMRKNPNWHLHTLYKFDGYDPESPPEGPRGIPYSIASAIYNPVIHPNPESYEYLTEEQLYSTDKSRMTVQAPPQWIFMEGMNFSRSSFEVKPLSNLSEMKRWGTLAACSPS